MLRLPEFAALILDVTDEEPATAPEYADDRTPRGGGLGLQLARDLALEVGWYGGGS
jgi:serine/threonine-protein kinase RsbW